MTKDRPVSYPAAWGALARSARRDLARLRLRRLLRRGEPYRYEPWSATVAGERVVTYNLDTLTYLVDEIFVGGCYEMGALPSTPRILDVGANIGVASLYFRRRYPGAIIAAIEADPEAFALLERNVGHHTALHHVAVGSDSGEVSIYRRAGKPGRLTASLDREHGGDSPHLVTALPLSRLITGRIDLLKMDIEGAEHEVLTELAASRRLTLVDRLVFELHWPARDSRRTERTLDLLRAYGFRCTVDGMQEPRWDLAQEALIVRAVSSSTPAGCTSTGQRGTI